MTPAGFPAGVLFTPVPDPLIKTLLLEVDDPAEIKATLYLLWLLHQKKGYPQFVTLRELLADAALLRGLGRVGAQGDEALRHALSRAVARGTFLRLAVDRDGDRHELFFLNTESSRRAVAQIERGRLGLGRPLPARRAAAAPAPAATPDIFKLYQENIGMLTPLIADELQEAERRYPPSWVEDAFFEAVSLNKRNWRYISRILERWSTEGKSDGKPGRHPEKASSDRK
ncbi:MAG: DnaD domain protein [Chloroflexi bacterium]|nr:DnaD domain protein [Chloroflexota bacterium]